MKRTINEIHKLIEKKIENAKRDMVIKKLEGKSNIATIIYGEIEAYIDIKILLETSGVLENEK